MANSAVDASASSGDLPFFRKINGSDPYPCQCGRHEAQRSGQPPPAMDIPAGFAKHSGKHAARQPGLHTATPTLAPGWGKATRRHENPALPAHPGHIGGRATSI